MVMANLAKEIVGGSIPQRCYIWDGCRLARRLTVNELTDMVGSSILSRPTITTDYKLVI